MTSRSARVAAERPCYQRHAGAYDALVTDPVEPWVDVVDARVPRAAAVLDGGCGTGRHAAALAARGHRMTLLDASPALLAIAARRCPGAPAHRGDVCQPGLADLFDAVTWRGVLNDLVEERERQQALTSLASLVAQGGVLVLDVREAAASAERADRTWREARALVDGDAELVFAWRPTWQAGLIVVDESYTLTGDGGTERTTGTFEMRPWSRSELEHGLRGAGLTDVAIGPGVGRHTPDRLLVTAARAGSTQES